MNKHVSGARSAYLDANIIIYFVEGYPELQDNVDRFFEIAEKNGIRLVTSEAAFGECLFGAHKLRHVELIRRYTEFFDDPEALELVPVERETFERAAEIGPRKNLKIIDAIHVATAISEGCDVFVTNDTGIKDSPDLKVVQLSEL